MRIRISCFAVVLWAIGCAGHNSDDDVAGQLAANQVVIGERITFTGADGKSVTPARGVYHVGVRDGRLAIYFGSTKKPLFLQTETVKVAMEPGKRSPLAQPRAVLRVDPKSPVRGIWFCGVDGTAHGAIGTLRGVRLRGTLLETLPLVAPDPTYQPSGTGTAAEIAMAMRPIISVPTANQVVWDRSQGISVRCDFPLYPPRAGFDSGPQASVALVHRATLRVVSYEIVDRGALERDNPPRISDIDHLDPGLYDVVVTDLTVGLSDSQPVRVVGASRTLAAGGPGVIAMPIQNSYGAYPYTGSVAGEHGTALVWDHDLDESYVWQWGACGVVSASIRVNKYPAYTKVNIETLDARPLYRVGQPADAVAAGGAHWLAIMDGSALAWGLNYKRQLGSSDGFARAKPTPVGGGYGKAVAVAAGDAYSLILNSTGKVYAFGDSSRGQCGRKNTDSGYVEQPWTVRRDSDGEALSDIVAIAAGPTHALALDRNGRIWGWGDNTWDVLDATIPTGEVRFGAVELWQQFTKDHRVRQVMAISGMSAALVETLDGELKLYTWGVASGNIADAHNQSAKPLLYGKMKPQALQFGSARDTLISAGGAASWFDTRCNADGGSAGEVFQLNDVTVCAVGGAIGFHVALAWEVDENTGELPVLLTTGDNGFSQLGGTNVELAAKYGSKTYNGETWFKLYFR